MRDHTGSTPLLLVVDDDARSRELMRVILGHAGYRVVVAPDARAAIELLEAERPAAVLADLLMPGMTGIEFCRWVRGRPDFANLRFLLLTGMDTADTRGEALAAGADAVLTKPFVRTQLVAQLQELLARGPDAP